MDTFAELESKEGLRFTWNCWPSTKIEAARTVIPVSVMVNPIKDIPDLPLLPYEPVRCRGCSCVLNPYCRVDFQGKVWVCTMCLNRNHLPPNYHQISEQYLPPELMQQANVVEYVLPQAGGPRPPIFLLVLDTALDPEALQQLREAAQQAIALMPDAALVGLVTFGSMVAVHELGFTEYSKAYMIRGDRDTPAAELQSHLGLGLSAVKKGVAAPQASGIGRFLVSVRDAGFILETALEDLRPDAFPQRKGMRKRRCTGAAVAAAARLLEASVPNMGARIMLFVGGPSTVGPGMAVSEDLGEMIRTHQDLEKGLAPNYKKSCAFYDALVPRVVDAGHTLDVFACSLDQIGLAEMKSLVAHTGGMVCLAEEFKHDIFRRTLQRVFEGREATGGFNGTLEVYCPREVRVQGALGPCSSMKKRGPLVSDQPIGQGETTAWKMCSLDAASSALVFFEVATATAPQPGTFVTLQFATRYQHASGQERIRVVTTARMWSEAVNRGLDLVAGFDTEAAAVCLARLATDRAERSGDESFDVLRWLDRQLIRVANRFGEYQRDVPDSFSMPDQMRLLPQFVFHLRRSQFMQVFGNPPDETAYFRLILMREGVANAIVMIQPTLFSYSLDDPRPYPVALDIQSAAPDRILLMDSYFMVAIQYGKTVGAWRKAGYQDQPEHAAFRRLLEAPLRDAAPLLKDRYPAPKLLECEQGDSQSRFLLAKLNPSATHLQVPQGGAPGEIIFTDDVPLEVFLEHLKKISVQS